MLRQMLQNLFQKCVLTEQYVLQDKVKIIQFFKTRSPLYVNIAAGTGYVYVVLCSLFYFPFSFLLSLFSTVFPLCLALACLCWLLPWLYHVLGGGVRPPFTHNTGRGTSSLSSSQAGSPPACGPSCASAWRRGWGSIPCRWCIGRVRHHCVFSGA